MRQSSKGAAGFIVDIVSMEWLELVGKLSVVPLGYHNRVVQIPWVQKGHSFHFKQNASDQLL